jgi:hypothetical protein
MTRTNLLPAVVSAVWIALAGAAPARAHDDARMHLHVPVNGCAMYVDDVAKAPVAWFARVPAPVWGVASLAVALSMVRRRRRVAPRGA